LRVQKEHPAIARNGCGVFEGEEAEIWDLPTPCIGKDLLISLRIRVDQYVAIFGTILEIQHAWTRQQDSLLAVQLDRANRPGFATVGSGKPDFAAIWRRASDWWRLSDRNSGSSEIHI
jgi:hypothetical protein